MSEYTNGRKREKTEFCPTPYTDVNTVLHELLFGARTVLGDQLVGMYLCGSLAGGDFDPRRSDIDFCAVTADELAGETVAALEAMHAQIAASGLKWATKLEGAYVPLHTFRRYDPDEAACPYINEGSFRVEHLGSDWVIQRHIIREHGVVEGENDAGTDR